MRQDQALSELAIEELVDLAKNGDTGAFEELVDRYQDRIYNYVSRMVRDPVAAQDIAQETFVRVYKSLPRFRGAARFQTWLYRIASNLAIDATRSRKRRAASTVSLNDPVVGDDDAELERELPDDTTRGPSELTEAGEIQTNVWQAVSELPPKLRMVVVLYDLQGFSYQEIAEMLDCPLGTVKSRLFNARSQLRDKLAERLALDLSG
jgi:RNA polymerase sigma-70 factor (ECF subfamily)